jgi:branched-chain amino acid transport system ATP-binding protein
MTALLQVEKLCKSFGGITAVNNVSFDVREGEILGIIGPNGSGKSTLFNCVLGQLTPNSGDVRVDGKVTTGMRPCDLNRIGVSRTFHPYSPHRYGTTSSSPGRNTKARCFRG